MAVTDLTNTKWVMNELPTNLGMLSGQSNFKIKGKVTCGDYTVDIGYYFGLYGPATSFSNVNTNVKSNGVSGYPAFWISKDPSNGVNYKASYNANMVEVSPPVVFEISGGTDATNTTLISWFEANTKQVIESNPTTITYKDTELASLKEGQTATLACAGKKMTGNIIVSFGSAGGITYDGSTTELEAGKTATLQCAGKKMATDVYITAAKA